VARRIARARERQESRGGGRNAELPSSCLGPAIGIDDGLLALLAQRGRSLSLSPRRMHRALRVARTIADLAGDAQVDQSHLDEALAYRPELRQ
jgi:magnesium chelatase family protein